MLFFSIGMELPMTTTFDGPVILSDAVVGNGTVMVHTSHTPVAEATVLRSDWFDTAAGVTEIGQSSPEELQRPELSPGSNGQHRRGGHGRRL